MLVTFMLLAILTIGAVSAADNATVSADELPQDSDDALAVEDAQEDDLENQVEQTVADDDADGVLSYNASDFNVEINESMDLADEGAAVNFDVPSGAEGEICVYTNYTFYTLSFDLELITEPQFTLEDLDISSAGSYFINVTFVSTENEETYLASGTIVVTGTVSPRDFNGKLSHTTYTSVAGEEIFAIDACPADGTLIVFVEGNPEYFKQVCLGDDVSISDSDLSFYNVAGEYNIVVKFNTTAGKVFALEDFDLDYDVESSSGGSKPYINLVSEVDFSSYYVYLVYISDDDKINGTVTLSIDGKVYYNEEFNGTNDYLFIHDTDLVGFDIGDFLGNHTVKVTYKGFSKESVVSFVFEPYFNQPYNLAVGESSCIVFKATSKSSGSVSLYNAVYDESNSTYIPGSFIGTYLIEGATTVVPLPALKTEGGHVFYVNYTINGKNDAKMFGIYASKNSNDFTSSISASVIGVNDSVTVKVTGPKVGGIDFYMDGTHCAYYSMASGTVQYTFSNLSIGKHIISVSFDGLGESSLFYSNSFAITVINGSVPKPTAISTVKVALSKTAFTYNGKVQKPKVTLTNGVVLKEGVDYTLKWSAGSPKNVGTYTVTLTGTGVYAGSVKKTFKINKAANPLAVKAKTVNVKLSAVKMKSQTLAVSKVVTFTKKGQGTLTYVKSSGNKKITINKKTGKVTIAKGLNKGTYIVKVKIKAAGNSNYKASAYKAVTFKIIIK